MSIKSFPNIKLSERLELRRKASYVNPDYTIRAIAIMLLSLAAIVLLFLAFFPIYARAEATIMYACTKSTPLNVRERPDLSAEIIGRIERGDTAMVILVENGWALVEGVGEAGQGWASMEYLSDKPLELPEGFFEVEDD